MSNGNAPVDGEAYVYSYDKAGNITGKYTFPYSAGAFASDYLRYMSASQLSAVNYGYSTGSWGDMLTSFNGIRICYDEIGNPANWHNALSMSWDKRELTSLTLNDNGTLSFTYNSSGLRTQKTYTNGDSVTVHNYVLDGTNIISETVSANGVEEYTLYYLYEGSVIIGFIYNNAYYYFQKNLQGDIVRILNAVGNIVTEYTYNAWGKVVSITGSMADTIGAINPFRYRGYYYDTETNWYYLQSRYYDPSLGRFINADGVVGANGGIIGYNMFAYCNNNQVMFSDPRGYRYSGHNCLEHDYEHTPLEKRILENHWHLTCVRDCFGYTGDIAVGFVDEYLGMITIEDFLFAMNRVDFQAPPVLIEKYNNYIKQEEYAKYSLATGTIQVGKKQILDTSQLKLMLQ